LKLIESLQHKFNAKAKLQHGKQIVNENCTTAFSEVLDLSSEKEKLQF